MKKKKIMFFIPSLGSGGAERVVSILSNKFVERGHEVYVTMLTHYKCQYSLSKKVNIITLNCDHDLELSVVKRYLSRMKKIRNAVKQIAPNIIISFMSETNIDVCLALQSVNIPIIVSERNDPAIDPNNLIKKIMRRILYTKPKGFVFQTPDAKAYFSKRVQNKSCIILNPINSKLPSLTSEKERDKRVVAVGRLNPQKNFKLLIDAFCLFYELHNDYILEIYGEGEMEKDLSVYINEKQMNDVIKLKGFCRDVHERIVSASMFVLSSVFEGMPNALIEAMAIGLPCISTNCPCGGPKMLINHKVNGLLVPIGDCNELENAMRYVAENPIQATKMACNAVKVKELVDVEKITNNWLEFIDVCLGEK